MARSGGSADDQMHIGTSRSVVCWNIAASPWQRQRVQPCSKRLKQAQTNSIYLQIRQRPRRVWRSVSLSLTLAAAANNKTPDRATAAIQLLPGSRLQPTSDDTKWTFWDSLQQRWLAHTDAHAHTVVYVRLTTVSAQCTLIVSSCCKFSCTTEYYYFISVITEIK